MICLGARRGTRNPAAIATGAVVRAKFVQISKDRSMCRTMSPQSGFVTSELYIVAAVMAILVVIAVPAYLDFTARSRIAEGVAVANGARDAVAKAFSARGPADMSQRAITGWTPPPTSESVQSVSIEKTGTVTIRYTDKVSPAETNQVQIVPVTGGKALDLSDPANKGAIFEWECGGAAGRTTVPTKIRPGNCR